MSKQDQINAERTAMRQAITAIIITILVVVAGVLCSCKTIQPYIPPTNVSESNHDSIRTEYVHDSIYVDRWHKEVTKGDTVFIHDSILHWRDKLVYIHDSIDNSRIDTIYNTVQVEKKGSVFLRNSGIALWIIIALLILAVIVGIVLKFAK